MNPRKPVPTNQREFLELSRDMATFKDTRAWQADHRKQMAYHVSIAGVAPLAQILKSDPYMFRLAMDTQDYCSPGLPAKKCYKCFLFVHIRNEACSRRCTHCKFHTEWNLKEIYGEWIENMPFRMLPTKDSKAKTPRITKTKVVWQWFVTITLADPVNYHILEGRTLGRIPHNWDQMGWATAWHRYHSFVHELRHQMASVGGDPKELMLFGVMEMQKRGVPHWHMLVYHPALSAWPRESASRYLWQNAGSNLVEGYKPALGGRFYLPKYLVKDLDSVEFVSEGVSNPRPFAAQEYGPDSMLSNVAHGDHQEITLAGRGIMGRADPSDPNA